MHGSVGMLICLHGTNVLALQRYRCWFSVHLALNTNAHLSLFSQLNCGIIAFFDRTPSGRACVSVFTAMLFNIFIPFIRSHCSEQTQNAFN